MLPIIGLAYASQIEHMIDAFFAPHLPASFAPYWDYVSEVYAGFTSAGQKTFLNQMARYLRKLVKRRHWAMTPESAFRKMDTFLWKRITKTPIWIGQKKEAKTLKKGDLASVRKTFWGVV